MRITLLNHVTRAVILHTSKNLNLKFYYHYYYYYYYYYHYYIG